jgi:xanthine dehydrogenase YagS FAD-binding subunit
VRALEYVRAEDPAAAVELVAGNPEARYLGGGTNLVDHLKLGITTPQVLVDISRLPLADIDEYDDDRGTGLRIGANVRNSDLAAHPIVRSRFPVLARAVLAGASAQIRHQATTGGNLLQRTRCVYFQDATTPCNKREPGSGCSAIEGYGRYNAILGASDACVATHPSDLAVALASLDASVLVLGRDGERRQPIEDLYRLPGDSPDLDTTLSAGDLILAVEIPSASATARSTYVKVRDRASFAFALVSVAAVLHVEGEIVRDVRVAWGGVAHMPWRARRVETALVGGALTEESVMAAVDDELSAARTAPESAYKVPMLRNATAMTLLQLAEESR